MVSEAIKKIISDTVCKTTEHERGVHREAQSLPPLSTEHEAYVLYPPFPQSYALDVRSVS